MAEMNDARQTRLEYQFTFEELASFLVNFGGWTICDASGDESLRELLASEAEHGNLKIVDETKP